MEDRQVVAKAFGARLIEAFRVLETALPPSDADQGAPSEDAAANADDRPRQGRVRLLVSPPPRTKGE